MLASRFRPRFAAVLAAATVLLCAPAGAFGATASPRGSGCDRLDDAACMLPFPNDAFTTASASQSGRRLAFKRSMMPRNARGKPFDPAGFKTFDGFSPGSVILAKVPGLDTPRALARTNPVGLKDLARYSARNAPVLVLDAVTGKRWPVWAEIDMRATRPRDRLLEIHPTRNFEEGRRYVVVLRNLRDAKGRRIKARARFAALRDGRKRTTRYQQIFRTLKRARVKRDGSLFLTWDFTVASQRSLSGRMQTIRDVAFAQLGDTNLHDGHIAGSPPAYAAQTAALSAEEAPHAGAWTRIVEGTVDVPCFLTTRGCTPGGQFHYFRRGDFLPAQSANNVVRAHFTCVIPTTATASSPAQLVLFGHGLLGSDRDAITSGAIQAAAREFNLVFCATPWAGMSKPDIPHLLTVLKDVSAMPTVADALQQGMLNALFLGRLMTHPGGLASNPLFQEGGSPIVTAGHLAFVGGSQGAILGGALTAFAPDFRRAALAVPGMNYSVLLPRSTQWDAYAAVFEPAYRDQLERPLVLDLMQILWDRGESGGVAAHVSGNPLPNTPDHQVLLQVAFGDHQVSQFQADALARTIGARIHQPALAPGRSPQRNPTWSLAPAAGGFGGSVITYWDAGPDHVAAPPLTNLPNRALEDPHTYPGRTRAARQQARDFLVPGGRFVDPCGGRPCVAAPDVG
jgi:hypothetical protein